MTVNAPLQEVCGTQPTLDAALEAAMSRIAPQWPLDRAIAVNPCWGRIDEPFATVHGVLRRLMGARLAMPASCYHERWEAGEILQSDLEAALEGSSVTLTRALAALRTPPEHARSLPLPSDLRDELPAEAGGLTWHERISQQISQFCAAWFDAHQADWHHAENASLFAAWLHGLPGDLPAYVPAQDNFVWTNADALPAAPRAALAHALRKLAVPPAQWESLIEVAVLRMLGWASYCAWRRWEASLAGGQDDTLLQLAAIRLSWEALIDDGAREPGSVWMQWCERWRDAALNACATADEEICWQRAHEFAVQREWCSRLANAQRVAVAEPAVQAVFCIDVRSEVFRRALEFELPEVETRGFAGFFGLPLAYHPPVGERSPRLPGLLSPTLNARSALEASQSRLAWRQQASPFTRLAVAGFTWVEALGLGAVASLVRESFPLLKRRPMHGFEAGTPAPRLELADAAARVDLAAKVLRAMGLVRNFAPLVLLIGHGAQCANNPHAAALQCGACGGHAGDVNARVLADLLNASDVRRGLAARGIAIPARTEFVAGLHNTTTDEVTLFLEEQGDQALARLRAALVRAGDRARAERAPGLGLRLRPPGELLRQLQRRARDWSETRPEWGLANNCAFVAAPRSFTRSLALDGRAFLHDYDHALDPGLEVLELILTAPLVVAHWINLQYHASTVDPVHFGAGNKVLHNVVGGNIGVFEGNAGDLRVGLPWQSVHDGEHFRHTPLRLSAFIAAPAEAIDAVLARHPVVRQLVDNEWLFLFRYTDGRGIEARRNGRWLPVCTS